MQQLAHLRWNLYSSIFTILLDWYALLGTDAAPLDIPPAAAFYVSHIPDLHDGLSHSLHVYSGHLSSDPEASRATDKDVTAHLFFVMIKARRLADKERIMFWFNGGPGCSSFDGLMMELGPWRIDGNGGLKTVQGGWEEYTTMVFVDQPAGTGFSYTSTDKFVHELSEASAQVLEFLKNFYQVFPELQALDMYVGGESYAGQYVPYIANAILESDLRVNLMGAAIGNGWIDGRSQYSAYLDYAVKHGLVEENSDLWKKAEKLTMECLDAYASSTGPEPININICERLLSIIPEGRLKSVDGQEKCMNIYDVRLDDDYPACGMNWPTDLTDIAPYLRRSDVKNAFHANAKAEAWVECSGRVGRELYNRNSPSSITLMPRILEQIPVLLFAGDQDFICNYIGIENLIQSMTWNGEKGLGTVTTMSWSVSGTPAGTWVESRNLTYVKIFNSSHMAPYDVPDIAHDMILRFMGMNFSAINDGTARIPSKVGDFEKPSFTQVVHTPAAVIPVLAGKTPEQDKAMWEAYYNAGSATLVLVLVGLLIWLFLYFGKRRLNRRGNQSNNEETIPLDEGVALPLLNDYDHTKGKKKEENVDVFDVGDSEDEANDSK